MGMTTIERERAAFEAILTRNTARLLDFARPYVARLCSRDKEQLLGDALERMWAMRKTHRPGRESLLEYWGRCLKAAALARKLWRVSTFDGHWIEVPGPRLGAEEI